MPIERDATRIGKVIVKVLACLWVKKPDLIAEIAIDSLADLFDQFASNYIVADDVSNKMSQYATDIARNFANYLRGIDISDNGKASISQEVFRLLDKTTFSMSQFAEWNYHYDAMTKFLFSHAKVSSYGAAELESLKKCIEIASKYILNLLPTFPEFQVNLATTILDRFEAGNQSIKEEIERVGKSIEHSLSEKGTQFESQYKECLMLAYGKINMFAASIDDKIGIYDMPEAYVYLQARFKNKPYVEISDLFETVEKCANHTDVPTILIVGDAGAGKTTLLQWIAVNVAQHRLDKKLSMLQGLIPVLIPLRRVGDWDSSVIENVVANLIAPYSIDIPGGWIASAAEKGRFLILIDGLDELSVGNRSSALKWLNRWKNKYPKNRIVITSRPLHNFTGLSNVYKAQIQPMNRNQIITFITRWHKAVLLRNLSETKANAQFYIRQTQSTILASQELISLARNPLLCALLCALSYKRKGTLPSSRNELYEECTKMLLEDREIRRNISVSPILKMDYTTKMLILDDISYWMMRNDLVGVKKSELIRHLSGKLPFITDIQEGAQAEDIINFLVLRSGLIREPEEGLIEFVHLTFMEFMAAREISRQEDWPLLLNNSGKTKWYETILLAVAFANCTKASEFVHELIKKSKRSRKTTNKAYYALLALSCSESARELNPECREEVLKTANTYIPPHDDDWTYIQNLGDRVIPHLANKSYYTHSQKIQCLHFLNNQFSSISLVNALKTYILADEPVDVVSAAILALYDCYGSHVHQTNLCIVLNSFLQQSQETKKKLFLVDAFFDLCARMNCKGQYSFSSIEIVPSEKEVSYKDTVHFSCNELVLKQGVVAYDVLRNFTNIRELVIYCNNSAATETLHQYKALEHLETIEYVITEDSYVLMGSDPILQIVENVKISFEAIRFEFRFDSGYYKYHDGRTIGLTLDEARLKLSNVKQIILNFLPVAISAFDYGEYISLQDAFLYFECATIRIIIDCRDVGAFLSGKTYAQLDQDDAKRVIFEIWNSRKSEETNIADTILEQNEGATIVFRRSKKSSKKQQRNS